ncbi:MAG: N-acetylneuraminate synthase family protein [Candidatus Omnitrophica bacterium]|nr:N-acetylneuraminate synthase family protein [Candidatus Omnitrophota bacterium]
MKKARQMVVEAAKAGADIVKFQSYRGMDVAPDDPEREWFAKVELSDEMHFELKELAEKNGVEFLSSPFTVERAVFLCEKVGLKKIKIASSEMLNLRLLDYVNRHAETVFLSTGLATIDEIRQAVSRLDKVKVCYLLHCVTQYPTPPEDINLSVITRMKREFPGYRVGFSDHTLGILAPVIAAALGAEVIEKHFTLDKTLPGTDHILSVDPPELKEMVRQIRQVEALLGDPLKKPTGAEKAMIQFVRTRFPK